MAVQFIARNTVDAIFNETKIENVVGKYASDLKKVGANYKCKSVFTNENTPSLIVSPAKQIFKCFSTGKGGNAIEFIMQVDKCSYKEALLKAAEISNIYVEYEELTPEEEKKIQEELNAKDFLRIVNKNYLEQFNKIEDNHWAKEMMKARGYDEQVITDFQIGFAPKIYDLISSYANEEGHTGLAQRLGYSSAKGGKSYDFFQNRLMFPILNERGEVIAFGGRLSNEDVESTSYAKYLNSKESEIYSKDKVLYGLFQAKKYIVDHKKAILVEGYTDVISLHNKGINHAIASCGTAFTKSQAKILKKYCKEVIIWRDGDSAGQKAILRDLDILLDAGFKVSVVNSNGDNSDPDEISRKVEDLEGYIERNTVDAILWRAENLLPEVYSKAFLLKIEEVEQWEISEKARVEKESFKRIKNLEVSLGGPDEKLNTKIQKDIYREKQLLPKDLKVVENEAKQKLKFIEKFDPYLVDEKLTEIAELISYVTEETIINSYVKQVAKLFEAQEKILKDKVKEKASKPGLRKVNETKTQIGVPEGGDQEQFNIDRFCEIKNSYHFLSKDGFFKGTTFSLNPLFHIDGRDDNKRLCEVISETGYKTLIDFESKDLLNFNRFQEVLFDKDDLLCDGDMTNIHFKLLVKKISKEFIKAKELKTLGWQSKGFFAYADGIFHNNEFKKVNKYGIIQLDLDDEEGEYVENHKHYYSPAFSEIYKYMQDDSDDKYENDRYLSYRKSPVDLTTWMHHFINVYGFEKGSIGLAFLFSASIRSHICKTSRLPMLGLFGEKGSGKSQLGESLSAFFFNDMPAFNLQNGTLPGFSRRLERTRDTIVFLEEYNDNVKPEIWQSMKSGYDNVGREIGSRTGDNRTKISKVNSSIIYAGQYLPVIDDGSVAERTIVLNFLKKMADDYTLEEKESFRLLKSWEKQGINSLILDVLEHKPTLTAKYNEVVNQIEIELRKSMKDIEYSERMMTNYTVLLAPIKILEDKINLPFTYDKFFEHCKNEIIETSDLVTEIGGMSDFWDSFNYLAQRGGKLMEDEDYMIDRVHEVRGYKKVKGVKVPDLYENKNRDEILFIDFDRVYIAIHEHMSKLDGKTMIGKSTLRNYFRSKKYFLKSSVSQRLGKKPSSCYTFNYTEMERMGILNVKFDKPTADDITAEAKNKINETDKYY